MVKHAAYKLALALTLLALAVPAGSAFAQSVTGTDPEPQSVTGTDPEPQSVTGTDPEPQGTIEVIILQTLLLA
jgi:hypothetical protein